MIYSLETESEIQDETAAQMEEFLSPISRLTTFGFSVGLSVWDVHAAHENVFSAIPRTWPF